MEIENLESTVKNHRNDKSNLENSETIGKNLE